MIENTSPTQMIDDFVSHMSADTQPESVRLFIARLRIAAQEIENRAAQYREARDRIQAAQNKYQAIVHQAVPQRVQSDQRPQSPYLDAPIDDTPPSA